MLTAFLTGQFAAMDWPDGDTVTGSLTVDGAASFGSTADFNDAAYFSDGVQAAPGIAFSGAHGTGFWRNTGNGNFAISVAGVLIAYYEPSGIANFVNAAKFFSDVTLSGSAPANHTSAGSAGQIAVDSGFIYVCTGTNQWKRVAIADWP